MKPKTYDEENPPLNMDAPSDWPYPPCDECGYAHQGSTGEDCVVSKVSVVDTEAKALTPSCPPGCKHVFMHGVSFCLTGRGLMIPFQNPYDGLVRAAHAVVDRWEGPEEGKDGWAAFADDVEALKKALSEIK